jgi:hypothetical protein
VQGVDDDGGSAPGRACLPNQVAGTDRLPAGVYPVVDEQHPVPGGQVFSPGAELQVPVPVVRWRVGDQPAVAVAGGLRLFAQLDQPEPQMSGDQSAEQCPARLRSEDDGGVRLGKEPSQGGAETAQDRWIRPPARDVGVVPVVRPVAVPLERRLQLVGEADLWIYPWSRPPAQHGHSPSVSGRIRPGEPIYASRRSARAALVIMPVMMSVGLEKPVLHEFLGYQRISVLAVMDGLDDEALQASVLPSGWTPLGLLEHLGHAERHWFQEVLTGSVVPLPWPDEVDTPLRTSRTPSLVFGFYREQCRISDSIIEATSLETAPVGRHPNEPLASQTTDLRRIMLHMIEETARHAGHLDAARELIDGRTGLGPR